MKKLYKNSFLFLGIVSFFVCFVLEALLRRSIIQSFIFLFTSPLIFIFNMAIIALSMSWGLLIKRRDFAFISLSLIWLGLGIGNFILGFFRLTPLCGSDFLIIKDALGIMNLYLEVYQLILVVVFITLALAFMVFLFIKGKKIKCDYLKGGITVFLLLTFVLGAWHINASKRDYSNLPNAYKNYGFSFSFWNTVFDRGIDLPEGYSQKMFLSLMDKLEAVPDKAPKSKPNIIFVQLESFFDVNQLKDLTFSENPIPNFSKLKNDFSSGYLNVPTFGGQTANTEFEVLTGIDINFFGAGECPFETTLTKSTCESIATNLKDIGYKAHAIHNHTATFYERHLVYPNLGFDTFTPIEYMNDIERNIMTWAKDKILLKYINSALDSTPKDSDFIYTVSAQAHGNYPKIFVEEASKIKVFGLDNEEDENRYTYYVNQIYETDLFIGDLIAEIEKRNEPTVVVFYGDHLPAFSISEEDLTTNDIYKTEYVIWDNLGLEKENVDLEAYSLSSHIMQKLDIIIGSNNKLNIFYKDAPDYKSMSKILTYSVFHKNKYVRQYEKSDMQLGITKPKIDKVLYSEGTYVVTGEGFSPYSIIYINGVKKQTGYVYENALIAYNIGTFKENEEIRLKVSQITQIGEILSETEEYIVK